MALFPLFSLLVNFGEDVNYFSVVYTAILYLILGFLELETISSLLDKYSAIIYKLAIVTIILGPIFLALPMLLDRVPIRYTNFVSDEYGYYNFLIYTFRVSGGTRAQSIFWEPGAWAINQAFALYWIVFKNNDYKKMPILFLSLLFTVSTTGFALGLILLGVSFITVKSNGFRFKVLALSFSVIMILSSLAVYINATTNIDVGQLLYDQVVGKFVDSTDTNVSYQDRKNSTAEAFNIAITHPFFGAGKKIESKAIFVTSSLAEIAYQLGLIYLFCYFLLYRVLFNKLGILMSTIFVFIMMNGEAYAFMVLSSMILIFGSKIAIKKSFWDKNIISNT